MEEKLASPKFAEGDFVKKCSGDGGSKGIEFLNKNCSYKLPCLLEYFVVVEFTLKFIQENGFTSPVLIKSVEGLDLRYVIFCAIHMHTANGLLVGFIRDVCFNLSNFSVVEA